MLKPMIPSETQELEAVYSRWFRVWRVLQKKTRDEDALYDNTL